MGDCRELLAAFPDNTYDAIVTDPPYELGFMGKKWDSTGIAYDVGMWAECLRVLKPGAHVLAFGGTRTYHRMTCAIEDAGFEIRDCLQWLYGTGFPKSLNLDGGLGTALKPANEPIVLARKPLIGTVEANVAEFGTGALNIDATRIGTEVRYNPPAGNKPGGASLNMSAVGMPQDAEGRMAVGRWPANVLLDEEAAAALDVQSGIKKDGVAVQRNGGGQRIGSERTYSGTGGGIKRPDAGYGGEGGASRFFYVAKPSRAERDAGVDGDAKTGGALTNRKEGSAGLNNPRAGAGRTSGGKNIHPTVKPVELMRYLVRLITPPGGHVLDPFVGSGTTGIAAVLEGCDFDGMDLSAEYAALAEQRIRYWREKEKQAA